MGERTLLCNMHVASMFLIIVFDLQVFRPVLRFFSAV